MFKEKAGLYIFTLEGHLAEVIFPSYLSLHEVGKWNEGEEE